ncbi:GIY-YIG nuclease family protein [Bacillus sp. RG28]|uniref:GIY-YIG nuclease family protein n=1 Tax=Gottfriedia endophytica TaxID=2820819 RepID=A0A940SLS2_9BACI|nr:GIY-YIG nuclease family protein [Gottfriedia endophytica]MBP0726603.1 GIY-YIG nuclease family protein [Gottfriedia endophytica]
MKNQNRKEIIKEYKQTHRPMGVYQIKNNVNDKILVGGSLNLDGIYNREKFTLKLGMHINKDLQKDWKEFGEENFLFEVLEQIKPKEEIIIHQDELKKYKYELEKLENKWLDKLQPYGERGYNKESVR